MNQSAYLTEWSGWWCCAVPLGTTATACGRQSRSSAARTATLWWRASSSRHSTSWVITARTTITAPAYVPGRQAPRFLPSPSPSSSWPRLSSCVDSDASLVRSWDSSLVRRVRSHLGWTVFGTAMVSEAPYLTHQRYDLLHVQDRG